MTAMTPDATRRLLQNLLSLNGWRSSSEALIEAFPHMSRDLSAEDIADTLDNLKVPYARATCREHRLTTRDFPALVIPDDGACYLALDRSTHRLKVTGADNSVTEWRPVTRRRCTVFRLDRFAHRQGADPAITVRSAFHDIRPMIPWLLVSSFLTNMMGLVVPLLIMAIYDRVIPSGAVEMLLALTVGVVVIGASDLFFRHARTRALAYIGWRGERQLTIALFHKLMSLPLAQLQNSGVHQQLSRFRQFEALRDMFTGQVMTALLDLPFVVIFLALLLYLAPQVGLMTLCVIAVMAALGAATLPWQLRLDKAAAQAGANSQSAVQDMIVHQRTLGNLGLRAQWLQRSMPLVETAEAANRRARQVQSLIQSLSQSAMSLATAGAIVLSAHAALTGSLSFGGLIAAIALVSKVLGPVQALYSSLSQIQSHRSSRTQADRVLDLPGELELGLQQSHQKTLTGSISFSSVTYRPDPTDAPVLSQASFACKPGELVVVMGSDASARTAVLDLIDGLYSPNTGTIEHDGIDIRQIAKDELRKSATYAPGNLAVFYGTVAQNFRLAAPSLSDDDITAALNVMGLIDDTGLLSDGIETRLTDEDIALLPEDTLRSLVLARCIARPSSVFLFAEPTNSMCDQKRRYFKDWANAQRGCRTVVVATADRSFLDLADRFIFLSDGRVAVDDTGETGHRKMQAALKSLGGGS